MKLIRFIDYENSHQMMGIMSLPVYQCECNPVRCYDLTGYVICCKTNTSNRCGCVWVCVGIPQHSRSRSFQQTRETLLKILQNNLFHYLQQNTYPSLTSRRSNKGKKNNRFGMNIKSNKQEFLPSINYYSSDLNAHSILNVK